MSRAEPPRGPLIPPFYFLISLLLMIALHFVPGPVIVPAPLRYAGLVVIALSLALLLWAAGLFRKAGTPVRPFEKVSALVRRGPYRFTRNPMYLGMACGLVGVGLFLGSPWPFVVVPAFIALIDIRFIRAEEALLERTFGSEYLAFKARVRRWV